MKILLVYIDSKIFTTMSKNLSIIAKNIRKFREKKGISQDKLSKLAGVTLHTITKIESVATPAPRIETVKKLPML